MDQIFDEFQEHELYHPVNDITLNPRINLFAVLFANGLVNIHRFSGSLVCRVEMMGQISKIWWTSDGKYLVLLGLDGLVRILCPETGKVSSKLPEGFQDSITLGNGIFQLQFFQKNDTLSLLLSSMEFQSLNLPIITFPGVENFLIFKEFICISTKSNSSFYRLINDDFLNEPNLANSLETLKTLQENLLEFENCFKILMRKLKYFDQSQLESLFVNFDEKVYSELVDIFSTFNLKLLSTKYQDVNNGLINSLKSLKTSKYNNLIHPIQNFLVIRQEQWEMMILWVRTIQEIAVDPNTNIYNWHERVTSSQMADMMNLLYFQIQENKFLEAKELIDQTISGYFQDRSEVLKASLSKVLFQIPDIVDEFIIEEARFSIICGEFILIRDLNSSDTIYRRDGPIPGSKQFLTPNIIANFHEFGSDCLVFDVYNSTSCSFSFPFVPKLIRFCPIRSAMLLFNDKSGRVVIANHPNQTAMAL